MTDLSDNKIFEFKGIVLHYEDEKNSKIDNHCMSAKDATTAIMALEELYQEALRLNGYDKQLKLELVVTSKTFAEGSFDILAEIHAVYLAVGNDPNVTALGGWSTIFDISLNVIYYFILKKNEGASIEKDKVIQSLVKQNGILMEDNQELREELKAVSTSKNKLLESKMANKAGLKLVSTLSSSSLNSSFSVGFESSQPLVRFTSKDVALFDIPEETLKADITEYREVLISPKMPDVYGGEKWEIVFRLSDSDRDTKTKAIIVDEAFLEFVANKKPKIGRTTPLVVDLEHHIKPNIQRKTSFWLITKVYAVRDTENASTIYPEK
jgi:hypothetical protein